MVAELMRHRTIRRNPPHIWPAFHTGCTAVRKMALLPACRPSLAAIFQELALFLPFGLFRQAWQKLQFSFGTIPVGLATTKLRKRGPELLPSKAKPLPPARFRQEKRI